jgi:hypothetical protein
LARSQKLSDLKPGKPHSHWRIEVAKALMEAGPLKEELLDFERHVTDSGRTTWGARTGKHDDIVLAVSLATWWAVKTNTPLVIVGPIPWLNPEGWVDGEYVGW